MFGRENTEGGGNRLSALVPIFVPVDANPSMAMMPLAVSYGAVNGANTIAIKASGNSNATLFTNKTFVGLVWRRHPAPHSGWLIGGVGALS